LKSELLRNFRNLFQEKKVRFDKRILIFFFFLLLSAFIWLLNTLDKEYIAELNFPVSYYNFPENRIEVKDLPEYFTLRVEASGYLLLKHKIGKSLYPLQIDISNYLPEVLLKDTVGFTIKSSNFREEIENQLSQQIKVINIKPESVSFLFSRKVSKIIPIKPHIGYTLGQQYIVKGKLNMLPASVVVSGPVNVLDTLTFIPTQYRELGTISGLTNEKLKLQPIKNLSFSVNNVLLHVEVEKYTESSIKVPVSAINLPDSIILQLIPDIIMVDYCTGLSNFNNIKPAQFNVVVDYNELKKSNTSKFSILVKNSPSQAFNIKLFPRTVDFVFKNKK
jgi:hypothetical protein